MIDVLIVDDETLARNRVKYMLQDYPDIHILGECYNGKDAYLFLQSKSPDIVFLDIQMPEMTGLELIETIGYKKFPVVIFLTAYDQYAVKAFEYCAVDYLLKPFDKERLAQAISQALKRLANKKSSKDMTNIQKLIDETKPEIIDRIFIKESGLIHIIETAHIDYIESSGNYVRIYCNDKSYFYRQTMKKLELLLDPSKFARVHRSFIVQINKIQSLSALTGGDYTIHLKNDSSLTLSRRYKENLSKYFKI